jgi:hypothetical protein
LPSPPSARPHGQPRGSPEQVTAAQTSPTHARPCPHGVAPPVELLLELEVVAPEVVPELEVPCVVPLELLLLVAVVVPASSAVPIVAVKQPSQETAPNNNPPVILEVIQDS